VTVVVAAADRRAAWREVPVDGVPVAALAPIVVLVLAWVAWCWWDIVRGPVRYLPKWAWALICVASVPVGGIVYLLVGRGTR
jgi:hypothetical protein